jgi:hypothetical protein
MHWSFLPDLHSNEGQMLPAKASDEHDELVGQACWSQVRSFNMANPCDQNWTGLDIVNRIAKKYEGIQEIIPEDGDDTVNDDKRTGQCEAEETLDDVVEEEAIRPYDIITRTIFFVRFIWNLVRLIQFAHTHDMTHLIWIGLDVIERIAKVYEGIREITDPEDEDIVDGDKKTGQCEAEETSDDVVEEEAIQP